MKAKMSLALYLITLLVFLNFSELHFAKNAKKIEAGY